MERILVVDDEASIRKAMQIGLAEDHFEIDSACDGTSGIQMGKTKDYDILITDLGLPDMTGLEVIQEIKTSNPNIIPIVITGKGSMQSSLEAIRLEVSDYIEKPLNLTTIKESISRGLKRRARKNDLTNAQIQHQSNSDHLTGLSSRSQFMQQLDQALADTAQDKMSSLAVMLLDIDGFKNVNDSYGYLVGDKVLIELSHRLMRCNQGASCVARFDGDTFAIMIRGSHSEEQIMAAALDYRNGAKQPLVVQSTKVTLDVSIGIVVKHNPSHNPDVVMRDAEMALECCKKEGGGQVRLFDKRMLDRAVATLQFENELLLGIRNNEFIMYYQPIIEVHNWRLKGFEALIRWNHPERGVLHPSDFIPKAEEIGIINDIGRWVLHDACSQLKVWNDLMADKRKLLLNINISGSHFLEPGFISFLQHQIAEFEIEPSDIVLELTESLLFEESERSIEVIRAIKDLGIQLAIDDFGTGYSAFSYLQQLPLDQLKIAKCFIHKLTVKRECLEIVKAIVDLSKRLGISVVAEGVENEAQYNMIKTLNVDMVQGFLFSKPVPKDVALEVAHRYWNP